MHSSVKSIYCLDRKQEESLSAAEPSNFLWVLGRVEEGSQQHSLAQLYTIRLTGNDCFIGQSLKNKIFWNRWFSILFTAKWKA